MQIFMNPDGTAEIRNIPVLTQDGVKQLAKLLHQVGNMCDHINSAHQNNLEVWAEETRRVYNDGLGGNKIKAIKYIRQVRGLGLKAAKYYVEMLMNDYSLDYIEATIAEM